eukprot:gene4797-874_t
MPSLYRCGDDAMPLPNGLPPTLSALLGILVHGAPTFALPKRGAYTFPSARRVGGGCLSLRQAVVLAAIFEGAGALFLGTQDKGMAQIFASWIISPILSGIMAALCFVLVKAPERGLRVIPFFIMGTVTICSFFIVFKGPFEPLLEVEDWALALIALAATVVFGVPLCVFIPWYIRRQIDQDGNEDPLEVDPVKSFYSASLFQPRTRFGSYTAVISRWVKKKMVPADLEETQSSTRQYASQANILFKIGLDIVTLSMFVFKLPNIHVRYGFAEVYHKSCERMFKQLLVITACIFAFADGSNNTANGVGPLAAVLAIYLDGFVNCQGGGFPFYIMLIGVTGLALGLITMGHYVMRTTGKDLTLMTPSRGFSAELMGALVVVAASGLGIPVATTHCQVGACIGIALASAATYEQQEDHLRAQEHDEGSQLLGNGIGKTKTGTDYGAAPSPSSGESAPSSHGLATTDVDRSRGSAMPVLRPVIAALRNVQWSIAAKIFSAWVLTMAITGSMTALLYYVVTKSPVSPDI